MKKILSVLGLIMLIQSSVYGQNYQEGSVIITETDTLVLVKLSDLKSSAEKMLYGEVCRSYTDSLETQLALDDAIIKGCDDYRDISKDIITNDSIALKRWDERYSILYEDFESFKNEKFRLGIGVNAGWYGTPGIGVSNTKLPKL